MYHYPIPLQLLSSTVHYIATMRSLSCRIWPVLHRLVAIPPRERASSRNTRLKNGGERETEHDLPGRVALKRNR